LRGPRGPRTGVRGCDSAKRQSGNEHVMAKKSARTRRQLPRVALLIETTRSYGREVLRGIGDYSRVYGPWLFHLPTEMPIEGIPPRDEWDGEGIIAQPRQNPK